MVDEQEERITMAQVIKHPYLTKNGTQPLEEYDIYEEEEETEDLTDTQAKQ